MGIPCILPGQLLSQALHLMQAWAVLEKTPPVSHCTLLLWLAVSGFLSGIWKRALRTMGSRPRNSLRHWVLAFWFWFPPSQMLLWPFSEVLSGSGEKPAESFWRVWWCSEGCTLGGARAGRTWFGRFGWGGKEAGSSQYSSVGIRFKQSSRFSPWGKNYLMCYQVVTGQIHILKCYILCNLTGLFKCQT